MNSLNKYVQVYFNSHVILEISKELYEKGTPGINNFKNALHEIATEMASDPNAEIILGDKHE